MAGLRRCAQPALGKGRADEDREGLRARRNLTAGSAPGLCPLGSPPEGKGWGWWVVLPVRNNRLG